MMSYHYAGTAGIQYTGLVESSNDHFDVVKSDEVQPSEPEDTFLVYAMLFWVLASAGSLVGVLIYCLMGDFGWVGLLGVSIFYLVGWGAVSIIFLWLTVAVDAILGSLRSGRAPDGLSTS